MQILKACRSHPTLLPEGAICPTELEAQQHSAAFLHSLPALSNMVTSDKAKKEKVGFVPVQELASMTGKRSPLTTGICKENLHQLPSLEPRCPHEVTTSAPYHEHPVQLGKPVAGMDDGFDGDSKMAMGCASCLVLRAESTTTPNLDEQCGETVVCDRHDATRKRTTTVGGGLNIADTVPPVLVSAVSSRFAKKRRG